MDNKHKIIIAALIGIIIVLGGAVVGILMKEPVKTVELFENGTTIQVSADTTLKSHDNFTTTYVTGKNTTIMAIDNNYLGGALVSKILSTLIVEKGEKQDNGLYLLDKNNIMEIGDQLGLEYDENNIINVFAAVKHNNTVNQSIIIIGIDEGEMINIINSIQWKQGVQSNATNDADINVTDSVPSSDKTYSSNDENMISDSVGGNDIDYHGSFDEEADYDDYYDDYDDFETTDSGSESSSESSSSNVETTVDE